MLDTNKVRKELIGIRPSAQKLGVGIGVSILTLGHGAVLALPPATDVPEEVLRTEIILDARSPVDGKPLTPAEYAVLQAEEQAPYRPPGQVSPKVRETVGLLKLRKFIKNVLPFVPIK